MDKVFIEGLEVLTTIGVYEWEKSIKQKLRFDLEMGHNNGPAELVETMAERVAELILNRFAVQFVKVRLTKPNAVVNAAGVGVEILRTRKV